MLANHLVRVARSHARQSATRSLPRFQQPSLRTARAYSNDEIDEEDIYVPRRALLFVPGTDERKAVKATGLGVDCVCLDCEDGVAMSKKEEARTSISRLLETLDFGTTEVAVRINPLDSPEAKADIKTILSGPTLPDALVVPKVEYPRQLEWLFGLTEKVMRARDVETTKMIRLITMVESPIGLINLQRICELNADEDSSSLIFKHDAIIIGGDDYAASAGATRTESNFELMMARQATVMYAKAYNLQALDVVNIHFKEPRRLVKECEEGAIFGFTGKQIIHPDQVGPTQKAFSPSQKSIEWAERVVSAAEEQEASGTGAFTLDGKMIDLPTVKQAQNILRMPR